MAKDGVYISFLNEEEGRDFWARPGFFAAGAEIYRMRDIPEGNSDVEDIIDILRQEIIEHGAIDQIVIDGHGSQHIMYTHDRHAGGDHSEQEFFLTRDLLDALTELQDELVADGHLPEGEFLTDRIVFGGCNVFHDLHEHESSVGYYRDYAETNGVELVGSLSYNSTGLVGWNLGAYVQFSPDGVVRKDPLYNVENNYGSEESEARDAWFALHEGRTAEEAEAALAQYQQGAKTLANGVQTAADAVIDANARGLMENPEAIESLPATLLATVRGLGSGCNVLTGCSSADSSPLQGDVPQEAAQQSARTMQ